MKHRQTKKRARYLRDFVIIFAVLFCLLFVGANFGALKSKFAYWWALRFNHSDQTYLQAQIDGLGPDSEVIPPDDRLVIPKLNIDVPITYPKDGTTASLLASLNDGVVWYPQTALPGTLGNTFIAGHSSQNPWENGHYPNVFALIDNLKESDPIVVYRDGQKYVYAVQASKIIASSDLSVLAASDEPTLTLMTCWPVGTRAKRLIVTAKLKNTDNLDKNKPQSSVGEGELLQKLPAVR